MRLVFAILFWMLWLHSLWLWSLNFSTEVVLSGVWDMPWLSATTGGWCHPEFVIMWQQTCIWVVSAAAFRPSTWFCFFSLCKKTWLPNIFACFCVWFRAVKHKLNVFDIVIVYLTRLYLLMVVFSVIIYCISTYFLNLISSIAFDIVLQNPLFSHNDWHHFESGGWMCLWSHGSPSKRDNLSSKCIFSNVIK